VYIIVLLQLYRVVRTNWYLTNCTNSKYRFILSRAIVWNETAASVLRWTRITWFYFELTCFDAIQCDLYSKKFEKIWLPQCVTGITLPVFFFCLQSNNKYDKRVINVWWKCWCSVELTEIVRYKRASKYTVIIYVYTCTYVLTFFGTSLFSVPRCSQWFIVGRTEYLRPFTAVDTQLNICFRRKCRNYKYTHSYEKTRRILTAYTYRLPT